ncbi:MAG: hypothetical protein AAGF11_12800 [Myxococcota bacterium]
MLTIRRAQLAALMSAPDDFVERICEQLERRLPDHVDRLGPAELAALVRRTIQLGHEHGISAASGLGELVALVLEFGEHFERSPEQHHAWTLLEHHTLPAALKVRLVTQKLRARTGGMTLMLHQEP